MCVYLGGDNMIEVAGEGSGQPEDVVILLPGVPQGLDLAISSTSTVLFVLPSLSYRLCVLHL